MGQFASARGMGRRQFLRLMLAGGAAAVIAACVGMEPSSSRPEAAAAQPAVEPATDSPFFKDPAPFIQRDTAGLEARMENMQGLITPNRHFFVRNNSVSLDLDASDWRLVVEGDGVSLPIKLTYDEVRSLPSHTLISYLECAGNHRALFGIVNGRQSSGTQWMTGAVGNGEWLGVRLSDVLTLAGVRDDAVSVLLVGLDTESPEEGFRYVLPVEKAMHPDTLLAYMLNGETLPRDHGYPLRAVVPGWVGSSHIKWLGRILVSSEQLWTRNNTTSYTLIGDDYPPVGESEGVPVTEQAIKSALALPWPAELSRGAAAHPRLRAIADGTGHPRRVELGRRAHVGGGRGLGDAAGLLVGAVRVRVGRGLGGAHHHDAGHGRGGQHAARRGAVQREGLPVQPARATPGAGAVGRGPSISLRANGGRDSRREYAAFAFGG